MIESRKPSRAVVIGSGFGGLSAAIRLQAKGIPTTLVEKRDKLGGRAYCFEQDGFTFDAGPTVITAPEAIEELFEVAGKSMADYVDLVPVNPFYRLYWDDGVQFDYTNDDAHLEAQIKKLRPGDVEGYRKFYEYSKEVFKQGYSELVHVPFLSFWDMIRVAPQLLRLKAHRSVFSTVSSYVKEPHLREAFSFHSLLIGGNPFSASSIYTLIHHLERKWGVHFPKGGTHALVRGLGKLFEDLGGEIRLNSEVEGIATDKGQVSAVKLKSGERLVCDLAVSNAEVMHTYRDLLKNVGEVEPTRRKLKRSSFSMSLFLIYFGVEGKYPNLVHHNILFGPRYKGLLNDIFNKGILADDFSLYLHAPSKTDPTLAPPGCETFYVLSPVPHLGKLNIDWKVEGPKYAERILTYLESKHIPGLKKNLRTMRIFTPEDFRDTLNSHLGSAFSLEPTLIQSAYFRMHNRDANVKGLYLVGAGTHPGAGVPGVINSAKATVKVILDDLKAEKSLRVRQTGLQNA